MRSSYKPGVTNYGVLHEILTYKPKQKYDPMPGKHAGGNGCGRIIATSYLRFPFFKIEDQTQLAVSISRAIVGEGTC